MGIDYDQLRIQIFTINTIKDRINNYIFPYDESVDLVLSELHIILNRYHIQSKKRENES